MFEKKYFRQHGVGSQHTRSGLECASGDCIKYHQYQPNGNQMCMVNFESFILAKEACDNVQCDLIVRYTVHRPINGIFQQQGR